MDGTNWQLTGIVLWLALGLLIYLAAASPSTSPRQLTPFQHQQSAVVGLLSAVILPALWSASPATLVTSWTLFTITCWVVYHIANRIRHWQGIVWSLLPIWLYSIAVALAAAPAVDTLITPTWSAIAISLALLTAALQICIWSFIMLPSASGDSLTLTMLPRLLSPLIGITLLARLVAAVAIPFSSGLLATMLGMLIILAGVWLAWVGPAATGKIVSSKPAAGLSLALAGVAFLSGMWAGPESLVAATRVLVFVSVALFLIEHRYVAEEQLAVGSRQSAVDTSHSPLSSLYSPLRLFRPQVLALAVGFLAIAGLPPTVGFASLAPLYETWMAGVHALLMVAMVLLLIPLLAVTYRLTQRIVGRPTPTGDMTQRPSRYRLWLAELAPLLLIVGVLSLNGFPLGDATIGTWLALFAAALGGLLLPHFLRQMGSVRTALREALAFRLFQGKLSGALRHLVTPTIDTFANAYAILESEAGLLWLLALLLLFWWIS